MKVITKTTNANNQYTTNTYNEFGRLVTSTDYAGTPTNYTYDSRNRLTSVKQYNGSTLASTTSYTYDGVGNVLTMTSGGKTTTYTYDRFGNVLTKKDALYRTKTYTYGVLGRLESVTDRKGIETVHNR